MSGPIMGFLCRVTTPAVHGVVESQRGLKLLEIVAIHPRVPKRCCKQARCLRRQIKSGRISSAYDRRQAGEGTGFQSKFIDHGVERAERPAVAPEHTVDIERRCIEALGDGANLCRQDKQKHGIGVDKTAKQPRTSDSIYFRSAAGYPHSAALV